MAVDRMLTARQQPAGRDGTLAQTDPARRVRRPLLDRAGGLWRRLAGPGLLALLLAAVFVGVFLADCHQLSIVPPA